MTVESATYLADLNTSYPGGLESKAEGDNHIRLLKAVLQATFPNLGGRAFRTQQKSTNYVVVANDNLSLIEVTAGSVTLSTNVAIGTLGNGFMFFVYANGFDVTFDPNSTETLQDGSSTSITIYNGELALVAAGASRWLVKRFFGTVSLLLPGATSPAQTAEGSIVWDTDSELLTVGTGSGRKTMVDTDTAQTLTNKTLTSPVLDSPTINTPTMGGSIWTGGSVIATTSGANVNLSTTIPTWAQRITIALNQVSISTTGIVYIQLSTGASFVITGYTGESADFNSSTTTGFDYTVGFGTRQAVASSGAISGVVDLVLVDPANNIWAAFGVVKTDTQSGAIISGRIALAGELDGVRLNTSAGNFDAGSARIMYS